MDSVVNFISDNYGWFLTISIILLFSLIGYIYDTKKNKKNLENNAEMISDEVALQEFSNGDNNKGINDMLSSNETEINNTENVEETPKEPTTKGRKRK